MNKLIFKVNRPVRKGVTPIIRITEEAMEVLEKVQAETGQNISFIASQMIKFGGENYEVEEN